MTTSLPEDSGSRVAMRILSENFDDKGMTYIMVEDVTAAEASEIATRLASIEGVANVAYVEQANFKNNKALYTVTLSDYDSTDGAFATMKRLTNEFEDKGAYYTGQSASSYFTKKTVEDSVIAIGAVIVVAIIAMLLFTSNTYFELVLMLLVFGVAVVVNMGTNFLFNGISYISNLVALVLQLALSIDYSVILLHRFMEERNSGQSPEDATANALAKGMPEILSGSLTTVTGLCALMLMTLPIGVEIGIALAKSIIASLLASALLMPALLVVCSKRLDKSKHKSFVPNITKFARSVLKGRNLIGVSFVLIVVLAAVGQSFNVYSYSMNGGKELDEAKEHITDDFGTLNTLVLVVPSGDYDKERELTEYVQSFDVVDSATGLASIEVAEGVRLTDSYNQAEFVEMVSTLTGGTSFDAVAQRLAESCFESYTESEGAVVNEDGVMLLDILEYVADNPSYSVLLGDYAPLLNQMVFARSNLQSEKYSRITFNINSDVEAAEAFALLDELRAHVGDYYEEYYMTGESVVCYEMAQYFPRDKVWVSVFTIVFIVAILFLTFKNLFLPLLLTLTIQGGIWINFAIPFVLGNTVSFLGYLLICAMQMGATIDYAIVLTNRYEATRGLRGDALEDRLNAMAEAQNAVFPTIITSGVILAVAGASLGIGSSGVVAQLGTLLGIGATLSMAAVLFVLPSIIVLTDGIIKKSYLKRK